MIRRNFILLVIVFCFFSKKGMAEPPVERKQELVSALDSFKLPSTNNLLEGEILWLKGYIMETRRRTGFPGYADALIQLGDEEEIKRVMKNYPDAPIGSGSFTEVGQPRIIEYMEKALLIDEPAKYLVQGDVLGAAPDSTTTAGAILDTLVHSWEVPLPVRNWAGDIRYAMDQHGPEGFGDVRAIVRIWWSENKEAVKARQWASLKPGHRLKIEDQSSTPVNPRESNNSDQSLFRTTPNSVGAATPLPQEGDWWLLPSFLGGGAVLLLAGLGLRKKSNRAERGE